MIDIEAQLRDQLRDQLWAQLVRNQGAVGLPNIFYGGNR
jgi:hypothetical protein